MVRGAELLVIDRPLSWYVDRLQRKENFTALTYGDGEFLVATGMRTNWEGWTGNKENITIGMEEEIRDSIFVDGEDIVRGTDLNFIHYEKYQGGDYDSVAGLGIKIEYLLMGEDVEWSDGVVWENASQSGQLGPLIKALREREVVLVSNQKLRDSLSFLNLKAAVRIPEENAYANIKKMEKLCNKSNKDSVVFVVCAGLSAIPLIMRLRKHNPKGTFLDLGSSLDVFARMGQRHWMTELQKEKNTKIWKDLVNKHLEGIR